ncbi:unnamed protein product [Rotaria sp. Silwood1]|nr:unnamed protein product [Rotaria sp. Silwood1]
MNNKIVAIVIRDIIFLLIYREKGEHTISDSQLNTRERPMIELGKKTIYIQFSSQIIFIRLLMHRCKWLRRSTIIYEISDLSNNANYSIRHVETDLLQDNDLDASIYLLNNDQICDFCKTK